MRLPNPMAARACALVVLGLTVATVLVVLVFAQHAGGGGIPEDWTHHHLVFSNPGTREEAIRNGTYGQWLKIVNDPRYIMQQLKRRAAAQGPAAEDVARIEAAARAVSMNDEVLRILPPSLDPQPSATVPKSTLHNDWSEGILTGTLLPNTFPAKYTFNPIGAATCATDYVVYPTGSPGATGAATIVAYNNLYATTCAPTAPTTYWAYNTGTGYTVTTSPVLSPDGTKVAFIQTATNSVELVVLKWVSSTTESVSSPGSPTTSTNITTCTAPCMTVTTVSSATGAGDTYSSPFYDYASDDALYVGDNASNLYKITGVFNGTTSPTVTSVSLNGTAYNVASPVYDLTSGCVFVGDSEGYLYSVDSGASTTTSVCKSGTYKLFGHSEILGDGGANEGIFDAPLVDSTAGMVYAFITESAAIGSCAATDNCVVQFKTSTITSGSTTAAPNAEEALGTGAATDNMYAGTFDNVYYSSSTPATPSGNIYAVGNIAAAAGGTLYRIPITSNALGTPVSVVAGLDTTHPGWASPLTEFCNNGASACTSNGTETTVGTDSIYFSMFHTGLGSCSATSGHGCVLAFNVSNPSSGTLGTPTGTLSITASASPGCWTTSAIIVDNASTSTGASQVYFVNFDGNTPGGRSTNCTGAVTTDTIDATQAAQGTL